MFPFLVFVFVRLFFFLYVLETLQIIGNIISKYVAICIHFQNRNNEYTFFQRLYGVNFEMLFLSLGKSEKLEKESH